MSFGNKTYAYQSLNSGLNSIKKTRSDGERFGHLIWPAFMDQSEVEKVSAQKQNIFEWPLEVYAPNNTIKPDE